MTRDKTLPPVFVIPSFNAEDDRAIAYRPEAVAAIMLLAELQAMQGMSSKLPKQIVAQSAAQIEEAWCGEKAMLKITAGDVTVLVTLNFIAKAKAILAERASA